MIPITDRVERAVRESGVKDGICLVFVPHTTAAVTVNENADPMVVRDMLGAIDRLIPLRDPDYRHVEGNSAAHLKASLFGCSRAIPVENGRLLLGVWQGVFFCEFDGPRSRQFGVKLIAGRIA